jgi:hypothetical protein
VNLTTLQTADFEQGQSAGMAEEAQGIDGDEDDQMEEDEDYEQ